MLTFPETVPFFSNKFVVIGSLGLTLIALCLLGCIHSLARTSPTNYILLGIFTFSEANLVTLLASGFEPLLFL